MESHSSQLPLQSAQNALSDGLLKAVLQFVPSTEQPPQHASFSTESWSDVCRTLETLYGF